MTMLRFDHLCIGYGKKCIARNLKGDLPQGTLTALLGINGSGKSTLLRTLCGLQPAITDPTGVPSSLLLEDRELTAYTPRELAQQLSIVLTHRPTVEGLTADDVVRMGRIPYASLFRHQSAEDDRHVARAYGLTHTAGFAGRKLSTLSDGERQRIFIAKALAQDTPLILLDEPTAFLDFPSKIEMMQLLVRLAHEQHKTILLSTHDIEPALQMADHIWLLDAGRLVCGTPDTLGEQGEIEKHFCTGNTTYDPILRRFSYHI